MSPAPSLVLTKKRPLPRTGVGQKSVTALLIVSPRFSGVSQSSAVLARWATQMSRSVRVSPVNRARSDAKYRLSPSGDCIAQPSSAVVLTLSRPTLDGALHAANCLATTGADTASIPIRSVATVPEARSRRADRSSLECFMMFSFTQQHDPR